MNYWSGAMNWPVDAEWKCVTCGYDASWLIWGLQHAHCRCNHCHTEYFMRDDGGNVVINPICLLKEEYKAPAKAGFEHFKTRISEFDDDAWDQAFALCDMTRPDAEEDEKYDDEEAAQALEEYEE